MLNVFPIVIDERFLHQAAQIVLFIDILFNAALDNIVNVTLCLQMFSKN